MKRLLLPLLAALALPTAVNADYDSAKEKYQKYRSVEIDHNSTEAKVVLLRGMKECHVRSFEGLTTDFSDVEAYKTKLKNFDINPLNVNNCFSAIAIPRDINAYTWYSISMDKETGEITRQCGDALKNTCEKNNTW